MSDDRLGAIKLPPDVTPGRRVRVSSHDHEGKGWAPEVVRQVVLVAPVSDLLAVLEAFNDHKH